MPARSTGRRWVAFSAVGGLGMGVQLATLLGLTELAGLEYLPSTALAVETAVLHNFLWHERWTWADRAAPCARSAVVTRLLRFHLANGLLSIWGNVTFTAFFVMALGTHYLVSNVMAIAIVSVLNFLAADKLVFVNEVE